MEDISILCNVNRWQILKERLNNLNPAEFESLYQKADNAYLIDVRTEAEFFNEALDNAINISYLSEDFWDRIEQLDPSKPCFIYCQTGRRSVRTCVLMINGGFNKNLIFNLDGGLRALELSKKNKSVDKVRNHERK